MRRFAIGLAAALLVGQAAAQGAYTIGVLTPHAEDPNYAAFPQALRALGYQEGKNLRLLFRSADRKYHSINLKTASAMGLAVPRSLLLQADHVVK